MRKLKIIATVLLLTLITAGCERADINNGVSLLTHNDDAPVFVAGFENAETKVYVDEDFQMHWTEDDRVSVFMSEFNAQYRFEGKTGDINGSFSMVTGGLAATRVSNANYGVYPYNEATSLSEDDNIELILPDVQSYAVNSFGLGANTMVAVTGGVEDTFLPFKNVCGYLVVNLYGDEVIKKVILEGNKGEKIAGAATVIASHTEAPVVKMNDEATTRITIDCGEGIKLGKTAEEATAFWFVIPPTTFENGFTVKAVGDGVAQMVKEAQGIRIIERNVIGRMSAIETICDTPAEGNVIFDDDNFKAYCVENFDINGDGEISYLEAWDVTLIDVNTDNISSLKGVECFVNLTSLSCGGTRYINSYGKLTKLDVSRNKLLEYLSCDANALTSLDLSNNVMLNNLWCRFNQLTSLDLSNNIALTEIRCDNNRLKNLNISNNTALTLFSCNFNPLSSLDLSNNKALKTAFFSDNLITSVDVSNNVALTVLDCSNNRLSSLDVFNNTELTNLSCGNNEIMNLDVSNNTALTYLDCHFDRLTSLDVSNNTSLTVLNCYRNFLTDLDVSKNTSLTLLDCTSNQLTSLGVSNNAALTDLYCYSNQLMNLSVSGCTSLEILDCSHNQLLSLDVNDNKALTSLYCIYNDMASLDVSGCTSLRMLRCNSNRLTSLDVSKNTALDTLYCDYNKLTSLDLSGCTSLKSFACRSNQITSLDISKNLELIELICQANPLTSLDVKNSTSLFYVDCSYCSMTSLDVSGCTAMETLYCYHNQLTNLDVSSNTALNILYCSPNPLTVIYLKTGQSITYFKYPDTATIVYKD